MTAIIRRKCELEGHGRYEEGGKAYPEHHCHCTAGDAIIILARTQQLQTSVREGLHQSRAVVAQCGKCPQQHRQSLACAATNLRYAANQTAQMMHNTASLVRSGSYK